MAPSMYLIRLDTKARMEEQNTRANLQERNALSQCHLEPASAIDQLAFRKQMQANRNRKRKKIHSLVQMHSLHSAQDKEHLSDEGPSVGNEQQF